MSTILLALLATTLATTDTPQQTATPPAQDLSATTWHLLAGYEQWALRDIARTALPMDGSPVAVEGSGPALTVRYDRARRKRLHRFEFGAARAGGFAYVSPLQTVSLPSSDRSSRLEGRYEFRTYPFLDVLVDGLDLGVGVLGGVTRRSLNREYPGASFSVAELDAGIAAPLSARFQRGTRAEFDVAWHFGLAFTRSRQSHSAGTGVQDSYSGGGGSTELAARATLKLAQQLRLVTTYVRAQDWRFSSHRTNSTRRSQIALGVTYGN